MRPSTIPRPPSPEGGRIEAHRAPARAGVEPPPLLSPVGRTVSSSSLIRLARVVGARLRTVVGGAVVRLREIEWRLRTSGGAPVEVGLRGGGRIRLHGDSVLGRLVYTARYERVEREFVRLFLEPGDTFVDLGAHFGLFTVLGASAVGEAGRVCAVEPCPSVFGRLEENVALNGFSNVTCLMEAVSEEAGEATLNVAVDGWDAWSSLGRPAAGDHFERTVVPTSTLDGLVDRGLIEGASLVKIDVEGWEVRVIRGGRRFLSGDTAPVLLVEFSDEAAVGAGSSCAELYREIESLGYGIYRYDPRRRDIARDPLREAYPYTNLIAARRPDAVRARLR